MNYFITYKRTKAHYNVHSCTYHEAKPYNPKDAPFVPLTILLPHLTGSNYYSEF